ncbi:MAG TPA: hypothetical protein VGN72_10045 [Tepidisphaeraceae bacterium]|jgi:hypothetical protein|nr:hypothetical protein [Tepidisphaeraceae bacterium]
MPNPIDTRSASIVVQLLTFIWGPGPQEQRYVGMADDLPIPDYGNFASLTKMEITPKAITGGISDEPWDVLMAAVHPIDRAAREPHATITCRVEEVDPFDLTTRRLLWSGYVENVTTNPDGQPGLVRFQIHGQKAKLPVALGILINRHCQNPFGDEQGSPCKFPLATVRQTGTITAIEGNEVTVVGATAVPAKGMWREGSVSYDGLELKIEDAVGGVDESYTVFKLECDAPANWFSKEVVCTPGCDGLLTTCRIYENELRFNGLGIRMSKVDRTRYIS